MRFRAAVLAAQEAARAALDAEDLGHGIGGGYLGGCFDAD